VDVTVVIITRDRVERLLDTLGRLQPLGVPVIVVDDGSRHPVEPRVAERFPAVRVVRLACARGAAARTAAVGLARTRLVAFSDDDSWWAPGSLERAAEALRHHPQVGLVAARVLVGPERRLDPVCAAMRRSPLPSPSSLPGPRVLGFVACGAVCRRDAYLQSGGFHPRYGVGGEEALIALDLARHGYACVYLDDVVAHHHPARRASDRRGQRRRQRTAARNDLWTAWLRLPAPDALRRTVRLVRRPAGAFGLVDAVRGVPWIAGERRPVSNALARDLLQVA
jgi:N-acetylglucosaminyl-diphospho-decaprenol L-rhamnosyltransferase